MTSAPDGDTARASCAVAVGVLRHGPLPRAELLGTAVVAIRDHVRAAPGGTQR